jgi:hypothetical protein
MAEWSTTSTYEADVPIEGIWTHAYVDAQAWPHWNPEIVSASLLGPLAQGAKAKIRFRNGARMTFTVVEFEEGRLFTDEARLPLARMGHRHTLESLPDGGTRLTNTIYIRGPLRHLWTRLLGRKAAAALADGQRRVVELAARAQRGQ